MPAEPMEAADARDTIHLRVLWSQDGYLGISSGSLGGPFQDG